MTDKDKEEVLQLFGATLRELRLKANLSQEELADKAGIDRSYLGAIERGEHNLALLNIVRLSMALEIPPSQLFQSLDKPKIKRGK